MDLLVNANNQPQYRQKDVTKEASDGRTDELGVGLIQQAMHRQKQLHMQQGQRGRERDREKRSGRDGGRGEVNSRVGGAAEGDV